MTTVLRKAIEMGYNYSRLARVTGINRWTVMEWVKDKSRQSTSSQCSTIVIERRDEAEERNEALQGQNSELVQASIS
jgi:transposase-like protein